VRKAWLVYLGVLVLGITGVGVLPGSASRAELYLFFAGTAPLVVLAGVRINRPAYRLPWFLAAAGLGCYFVADCIYYYLDLVAGWNAAQLFPTAADAFYLASYPLAVSALLAMLRRRDRGRDITSLIDASIIAAAVTLVYWVFLAHPQYVDEDLLGRLVVVGTFVADIVLLAIVVRLLISPGRHRQSINLIGCGVVALLIVNLVYYVNATTNAFELGTILDAGWLLFYGLWAAAALHPTMRNAAEPTPRRRTQMISWQRLALLTAAVLIAPVLLFVELARENYADAAVVTAGSVVLFALVLGRIAVLMRQQDATAARERALRRSAASLVGATRRDETYAAALDAVADLVGGELTASRLAVGDGTSMEVVAAGGLGAAAALGRLLSPELLPPPIGSAPGDGEVPRVSEVHSTARAALSLDHSEGDALFSAVRVQGELRGAVVAITHGRTDAGVPAALDTLAAQVALAVESATLTEDLHLRQSEARFRALVQNSSDAITLVDPDAVVTYETPSVERVLGYPGPGLVGRPLLDLAHPGDLARMNAWFTEITSRRGATSSIELRLMRGDGTWLEVEAVGNNLEGDPNVGATVVTIRDVSERKQFERRLSHQAFHDSLTELANRALLNDRLEHALTRRNRDSDTVALLVIDLDDFKVINDSLGHAAGDALIVEIADRLRNVFRPSDTTARLGGDEFAVVLEGLSDEDGALRAVERTLEALREPLVVEGKEVFVQASIGVAFARDASETAQSLFRNADVAMYVAKAAREGSYAVYEERMHEDALRRLDLRADLQRALDNDEFLLHFQPIVSLQTTRTVGFEALVRWQHPERGTVAPGEFMALAEETGLIVPLGRWVLERACRQAAAWQHVEGATMSINLSQKQLRLPDLTQQVEECLNLSGVDPARITLEITESAVMSDVVTTVRTLHALRRLGVRMAVDDFGTGYSSLSWLRQLPIDILKIDKEFVDGIALRTEDSTLVGAVIDLAHNLGLRTVAEGIERVEQLRGLERLRCDFGQGYYFAKPLPAGQVEELLVAELASGRGRATSGGPPPPDVRAD
jgi:diguanylate cyclase (GGDEF)-like protein/PAS domain S-box-containing protein